MEAASRKQSVCVLGVGHVKDFLLTSLPCHRLSKEDKDPDRLHGSKDLSFSFHFQLQVTSS